MILFERKENGELDVYANNGCDMWLPNIEDMQDVITYCKKYISKYKTNQAIDDERYRRSIAMVRENQQNYKRDSAPRKSSIYLIKDTRTGLHKIGRTKNISNRFKQLKTANASIELVAVFPGVEQDEKIIHNALDHKRVTGEWFDLHELDIQYINKYFEPVEIPF